MKTERSQSIEARAQRRVRRKIGFFIHATVFVLVNLGLFALNQLIGEPRWHTLPLLGWGLGLAIHGIVTFLSLSTDDLRRRLLDQEIQALQRAEGR
ncbi:2TM domain-containing protein [Aquabacterium sp.]|uniref:2TM domain-containing protein n=1 Tax=Aquabacterium sp. TaxID=1872578 RepID=UPI003783B82B